MSARQPLFTGFRVHNQTRAAARRADAVAFQAEAEAADVAFQIRQAYWRLYRALALRDVAEQALAQVDAFLNDVRNRRAAGAATGRPRATTPTARRADGRSRSAAAFAAGRVVEA